MSTRAGQSGLLLIAAASLAATGVVSALAVADVISDEWFFGAPLIGASLSAVGFSWKGDWVPRSVVAPTEAARHFTSALRRLEAERRIQQSLEDEIRRTLFLLESQGEGPQAVDYLGVEYLTQHLLQVERHRDRAAREIEGLLRKQAEAHAELIVAAQERGDREAHQRDPDELLRVALRDRGTPVPRG